MNDEECPAGSDGEPNEELRNWFVEFVIEPIAQRPEWKHHPQITRMKEFGRYLCYKNARYNGVYTLQQRTTSEVTSIDNLTRIVENGFEEFARRDPASQKIT